MFTIFCGRELFIIWSPITYTFSRPISFQIILSLSYKLLNNNKYAVEDNFLTITIPIKDNILHF